MPVPFLNFNALVQIEEAGWNEVGIELQDDPLNVDHIFEDETRALQLIVTDRQIAGDRWANVLSSYFYYGTRTRYPVAPIVHAEYADGRVAADELRSELQFLKSHGVRLGAARLHRITTFEKKRTVTEGYFLGGQP